MVGGRIGKCGSGAGRGKKASGAGWGTYF